LVNEPVVAELRSTERRALRWWPPRWRSSQTKPRATEDISPHIHQIQQSTKGAVDAIRDIGLIIEEVHQIATSVAAAVEEQQAATQEIARNVSEAARGTQNVSESIVQVQGAATHAGSAASQVLAAAGELASNSNALSREVEGFLQGVRAA
jgi:methyl-accepting chemotaxis protein